MSQAMTIATVLGTAVERLNRVGCNTPQLDAEVLLAHTLNQDRTWLYTHFTAQLQAERQEQFFKLIARRSQREPVAYIVGHKEFFGLEFLVDSATLIPRPETELLVETALQLTSPDEPLTIADVGTGSGCIAISLATRLQAAIVFALDISAGALQVARHNAQRNQISNSITFLLGNLLEPLSAPVDLIVSNPPYVSQAELKAPLTPPEVNQYEPRLALDGGHDGLGLIRQLLLQAKQKLNPKGRLLVEIGSGQGQAVRQLALGCFPRADIQLKQDLAGLDRLLVVQL
jgi:release factor glutamine methyltransferase